MPASASGVRGVDETSTRGSADTCSCCLVGGAERGVCRAVRDLIRGGRSCVGLAVTATVKRSRSGGRAATGSPSRMELCTVAITETEKAILDRFDDGFQMLKPLLNDAEVRKWLIHDEVRLVMQALGRLAEARYLLAARFNR